jgi:hypothetical protein
VGYGPRERGWIASATFNTLKFSRRIDSSIRLCWQESANVSPIDVRKIQARAPGALGVSIDGAIVMDGTPQVSAFGVI